ncbi:MAG: class I SAM-dependent methyltransferase [Clostridia bacterium]|nr:class I SAM-dependent methyltransferase [Clostridiales bacterium]MBQ7917470.1 class I SAM-dependent methyltransferase [Clostridia bacterium]
MKNVADFYNKTATGWSEEWYQEKKQNTILEKYYNCFAQGGTKHPKILDLGCGAGYDSKILTKMGSRVVGVDFSEKLVRIAKKNVPNCKFFLGDMTDKFDKLGKFDGILCLATIMHVDVTKMKQTFVNMSNALKKGGLLLISSFDGVGKNYEKSIIQIDGEVYDKDFNNYNASELCAFAYPKLKLVDTWKFEDFAEGWRYYVFMKTE